MKKNFYITLVVAVLFVSQVACTDDNPNQNPSSGGIITQLLRDETSGQMCDQ